MPPKRSQSSKSSPKQSHKRKDLVAPDHIPRPRNAFILFRSDFVRKSITKRTERDHRQLSKIVGQVWKDLAPDDKEVYEKRAAEERDRHEQLYPGYRHHGVKRTEPPQKRRQKVKTWEGTVSDEETYDCTQSGSQYASSTPTLASGPDRSQLKTMSTGNQPPLPSLPFPLSSHEVSGLPSSGTVKRPIERSKVIAKLYARGFVGEELEKEIKRREEEGQRLQEAAKAEQSPPPISFNTRPTWAVGGPSQQLRQYHSAPAGSSIFIAPKFIKSIAAQRAGQGGGNGVGCIDDVKPVAPTTLASADPATHHSPEAFVFGMAEVPRAGYVSQTPGVPINTSLHADSPTAATEVASPIYESPILIQNTEEDFYHRPKYHISPPDCYVQWGDLSSLPPTQPDPLHWSSFANPYLHELILDGSTSAKQSNLRECSSWNGFPSEPSEGPSYICPQITEAPRCSYFDGMTSPIGTLTGVASVSPVSPTREETCDQLDLGLNSGSSSSPDGYDTAIPWNLTLDETFAGYQDQVSAISDASLFPSGHLSFDALGFVAPSPTIDPVQLNRDTFYLDPGMEVPWSSY